MIFEDRESANAANDKVRNFVRESLHDLELGDPEIIAGEVLLNSGPMRRKSETAFASGCGWALSDMSDPADDVRFTGEADFPILRADAWK